MTKDKKIIAHVNHKEIVFSFLKEVYESEWTILKGDLVSVQVERIEECLERYRVIWRSNSNMKDKFQVEDIRLCLWNRIIVVKTSSKTGVFLVGKKSVIVSKK